MTPTLGGSGLLVALSLADAARDWDVTVDAPETAVRAALIAAGIDFRDDTTCGGLYATQQRLVIDGGDHDIDLLVSFALHGHRGIERLPSRVTGRWRGLPLGDPVVWMRAYQLLGRPKKAAALEGWLTARSP